MKYLNLYEDNMGEYSYIPRTSDDLMPYRQLLERDAALKLDVDDIELAMYVKKNHIDFLSPLFKFC